MSRTLASNPWEWQNLSALGKAQRDDNAFLLVCVWLLIVYEETVHCGCLSLGAYGLKTIPYRDHSLLRSIKAASFRVQLCIINLTPCLSVCTNSVPCFSGMQQHRLSVQLSVIILPYVYGAAVSPSERTAHPIPAFLGVCVCLSFLHSLDTPSQASREQYYTWQWSAGPVEELPALLPHSPCLYHLGQKEKLPTVSWLRLAA